MLLSRRLQSASTRAARLLRQSPVLQQQQQAGLLSPFMRAVMARGMAVLEMPLESLGDSISTATVLNWRKQIGEGVQTDDVVCVVETDKVTLDVNAKQAGVMTEQMVGEGDEIEVGAVLYKLDTDAEPTVESSAPATEPEPEPEPEAAPAPAADAPAAPAPAAPAATPAAPAAPKASTTAPAAPAPAASVGGREETRVKMTRMRQRIAERLKSAQNTAAMLTTFQETDMGNLMEMRKEYKDEFEKVHGVRLGFMSAFVKAATGALKEVPAVNAYIDDKTSEIVYRDYMDVSVAVASPDGLVVPVLRNTETMSFADVERSIADYAAKARDRTLTLEEMAGGTFTISNGGVFGSLMGTPIINPPQSAILGMHATKMRPAVYKGEMVPRPMMYLALTYDHRLIDGREAVTFLKSIAQKIEDPQRLLLDL